MTPSTNQQGEDTEYESREHRLIQNNSTEMITKIHPESIEKAQDWLGAANDVGDLEMQEHFYEEIQRLKDD